MAKDVAEALGYPESSLESIGKLFRNVPAEWADRKRIPVRSENGVEQSREMLTISEQGLYFFLLDEDEKAEFSISEVRSDGVTQKRIISI